MAEIRKDMMPLFEWHSKWHYGKQVDFVEACKDYWEIVFVAGNGTGKSHIFYWVVGTYSLGIHPYQHAQPPLKTKILINDFEHGYGKIFKETCMEPIHMPERFEVWDDEQGKLLAWYAEEKRSQRHIEQVGGNLIVKHLPESEIGPLFPLDLIEKEPTRDDRTLYLKNKSLLFFQTSEQKKKQHSGTNFDILGCDEESEWSKYDESIRGLRRAKGGGKVLHAFTPPFEEETKNKGPTWTKFKLIDPFEKGDDPDICVINASVYDNPALTDTFIRKFSKNKTEEQLKIQLYGKYPTWGKLIFPDFQDDLWGAETKMGNLLPESFETPWDDHDVAFEMSLDWHGSKPPAVVWSFEYTSGPNKGDVVIFDELSPQDGKNLTISDTGHAIREIEGWRKLKIKRYGDPKMKDKNNALISGFTPWKEFRHCGIRLTEAWNRDPYVGYSIMNDFIRGKGRQNLNHPRLFVRENCKAVIHNMKNHYNVPQGDGTAKPDPKFSDYCVNVKYIMQNKSRKVKKNMDKAGEHSIYKDTNYTSIGGAFGRQYARGDRFANLGYGGR